jgi:PAS domain S-box-containing protein
LLESKKAVSTMNSAVQTPAVQTSSPIDFEQLVEVIGDAVVISDARGAITLWNPAAERMFGFTQEEALGNSLDLIIPERLRGRHWSGYEKTMATGNALRTRRAARAGRAQGRPVLIDCLYGRAASFSGTGT